MKTINNKRHLIIYCSTIAMIITGTSFTMLRIHGEAKKEEVHTGKGGDVLLTDQGCITESTFDSSIHHSQLLSFDDSNMTISEGRVINWNLERKAVKNATIYSLIIAAILTVILILLPNKNNKK